MIPRQTLIPWTVMLIAVAILTAATTSVALYLDFHEAKWMANSHPPLRYPTLALRLLYPYVWILPLLATAFGVDLLRRSEVSSARFSWFFCSLSFALFSWYLLIAVSFYLVYSQTGHNISPL
jgi:hypothetical protein